MKSLKLGELDLKAIIKVILSQGYYHKRIGSHSRFSRDVIKRKQEGGSGRGRILHVLVRLHPSHNDYILH